MKYVTIQLSDNYRIWSLDISIFGNKFDTFATFCEAVRLLKTFDLTSNLKKSKPRTDLQYVAMQILDFPFYELL